MLCGSYAVQECERRLQNMLSSSSAQHHAKTSSATQLCVDVQGRLEELNAKVAVLASESDAARRRTPAHRAEIEPDLAASWREQLEHTAARLARQIEAQQQESMARANAQQERIEVSPSCARQPCHSAARSACVARAPKHCGTAEMS